LITIFLLASKNHSKLATLLQTTNCNKLQLYQVLPTSASTRQQVFNRLSDLLPD